MARDARREEVTLAPAARADLSAHARSEAPNECCGLLIGYRNTISSSHRARNLRSSPTSFLIDPEDYFAAVRAARVQGLRVIGAYHSHPSESIEPSRTDLAEASGDLEFLYVIVSAATAEMCGYRLKAGTIEYVTLI